MIVLSILCAFFLALTDLFTKKYSHKISTIEIAFGKFLFAGPILWVFVYIDGIPLLDTNLIWVYIIGLPLEFAATLLYIRAIIISPLSLTVPFLSLTPAFLLITSPILMNEYPPLKGMMGILLIVIGAYALNLDSIKHGFLAPFRMISKEKGSMMMKQTCIWDACLVVINFWIANQPYSVNEIFRSKTICYGRRSTSDHSPKVDLRRTFRRI